MADLPPRLLGQLTVLAELGFQESGQKLSAWLGVPVRLEHTDVALLPVKSLADRIGRPDDLVVAIHTSFRGDLAGEIVFLLPPNSVAALEEALLPEGPSRALRDSFLSEVGNIAASSFLNVLANWLGIAVHISPPVAVEDFLGAVLGSVLPLVEVGRDTVLAVATCLRGEGQDIAATFLFLPDAESFRKIEDEIRHGGAS